MTLPGANTNTHPTKYLYDPAQMVLARTLEEFDNQGVRCIMVGNLTKTAPKTGEGVGGSGGGGGGRGGAKSKKQSAAAAKSAASALRVVLVAPIAARSLRVALPKLPTDLWFGRLAGVCATESVGYDQEGLQRIHQVR